jgi:hypothetical protein
MKRETKLTKSEEEMAYDLVDKSVYGACYHDKYLNLMRVLLLKEYCGASGMTNPQIVCETSSYNFLGNNRNIVDIEGGLETSILDAKEVFAYFDHPVPASALYLGTFNKRLIYPLVNSISKVGAQCYSTPLVGAPMTFKIDMHEFKEIWDKKKEEILLRHTNPSSLKKDVILPSKLKYLNEKILGPEELFDVIQLPYQL